MMMARALTEYGAEVEIAAVRCGDRATFVRLRYRFYRSTCYTHPAAWAHLMALRDWCQQRGDFLVWIAWEEFDDDLPF